MNLPDERGGISDCKLCFISVNHFQQQQEFVGLLFLRLLVFLPKGRNRELTGTGRVEVGGIFFQFTTFNSLKIRRNSVYALPL